MRRLFARATVVGALLTAATLGGTSPALANSCAFHHNYVNFYLDHAYEAAGTAAFEFYMRAAIAQLRELVAHGC